MLLMDQNGRGKTALVKKVANLIKPNQPLPNDHHNSTCCSWVLLSLSGHESSEGCISIVAHLSHL